MIQTKKQKFKPSKIMNMMKMNHMKPSKIVTRRLCLSTMEKRLILKSHHKQFAEEK